MLVAMGVNMGTRELRLAKKAFWLIDLRGYMSQVNGHQKTLITLTATDLTTNG